MARAADDLLDADNNLRAEQTPFGLVCFHCQQAAEKCLKAFLAAQGEYPPPTHDLLVLVDEVRPLSPAVDSLWDDLAALTAYAVETRYPDDWSELSREDAEECRRAADRRPFFCWTSFYRPHQPYTPLPAYWNRFDRSRWGRGRNHGDAVAMPPGLRQNPAELPPMLQGLFEGKNRVWRLDLARQNEPLYRDYITAYYALVEEIDDCVGAVLGVLEETGLRENTIVVYTADHGDFVGRHGMVEKCAAGHNVFEETLRVPLIVSWPAHLQCGAVCDGLAELVDLYPTLLELCGFPAPAGRHGLQGTSLAPTLYDSAPIERKFTVSENWSQATIITRRHKLGVWQPPPPSGRHDWRSFGDMLFDREKDPLEMENCAGRPAYARVEAELRRYLADWQRAIPDTGRRQAEERRAQQKRK